MEILIATTWNSSANSSTPRQISFSNSKTETQFGTIKPYEEAVLSAGGNISTLPFGVLDFQESFGSQIYEFKDCEGSTRNGTKSTRFSSSQEHVMAINQKKREHVTAERKRREKLNQRLIALSAMVPGLKKDEISVLGDAINYVKQLEEQVKTLEEQASKTKSIESVVYVKKYELLSSEINDYGGSGGGPHYVEPLPEIEARSCDKNVLIRIHTEIKKGVVEKIVAEIDKLHLSVVNSSVLSFGTSDLIITIIAQMDEEFSLTMKDLVQNLQVVLFLFM